MTTEHTNIVFHGFPGCLNNTSYTQQLFIWLRVVQNFKIFFVTVLVV